MQVTSEIGRLKKVLLHRPGLELEHLLPAYMGDMLFDEIPWLKRARDEHDRFAQTLRDNGVEVFYVAELVADIMAEPDRKQAIISEHLKLSQIADTETFNAAMDYLLRIPNKEVAELLTAGLHKLAVRDMKQHLTLSDLTPVGFPFYLSPLPSMYFMRDHGVMLGDNIIISTMFSEPRRREPLFLMAAVQHHPLFSGTGIHPTHPMPRGIEGGDVLVLNQDTLLVGLSERTTEQAIETLAQRLLIEQPVLKQILVMQIPLKRAYMHLDTVFTMLDRDKFLFYPGIRDSIWMYRMTSRHNRVWAEQLGSVRDSLEHVLEYPIQLIHSGGHNIHQAAREQWNDSTNTLAIAPGKVVVYNRNTLTNKCLEQAGIEVIEVEGSELVRGRGGPRCMSLPLEREPL